MTKETIVGSEASRIPTVMNEVPTIHIKAETDRFDFLLDSEGSTTIVEGLTQKPLEKYDEHETVGHGGMKHILKVRDQDTARDVAMAVMRSDIPKRQVDYFIREARIVANLEHPNIVPVYDIGTDKNKTPYFTMKLIKGESLGDILVKQREGMAECYEKYPLHRLIEIFQKVCDAIAFAHSKKVIHLDLKPDNVLVGDYGEVLVLDWGLAKIVGSEGRAFDPTSTMHQRLSDSAVSGTMKGTIKGTPGYMAPEQAMGMTIEKDITTDIYSLGGILYSILTKNSPIDGTTFVEVVNKTIDGEIIPPSVRTPERNIPKSLEAIVMKAMSMKCEDRYPSVRELRSDLDAYVAGFATSAENAGMIKHLSLLIKRRKTEFAAIAAGIVVLLAVSVVFKFKIDKEKHRFYENEKRAQENEEKYIQDLENFRKKQRIKLRLSKGLASSFLSEAKKHSLQQKWAEALVAAETAVELDPDAWQGHWLLGRLQFSEMDFSAARNSFAAAQRLMNETDPDYEDICRYNTMADRVLALQKNRKLSSKELMRQALKLMNEWVDDPLIRVRLATEIGQIDQAGKAVSKMEI